MNEWGKVAIAARLTRIHPMFFFSWSRLITSGIKQDDVILTPSVGMPHSIACNYLCVQFLKSQCDSVLFVDDDMLFEADALSKMRNSGQEYGIMSALCPCRNWPHEPIALRTKGHADGQYSIVKNFTSGVVECDSVGLAFTLIKRSVIEGIAIQKGTNEIFAWHNRYGEDGQFCRDAAAIGFRVAVNSDVNVGHQVEYTAIWSNAENKTVLSANRIV